ncbi:MAG: sulfite exporter TauE/SafE family protein [Crocinitomix sp.]|nr:sulfite exporter TauE/SafE family protein [Crocinitomix sp.]
MDIFLLIVVSFGASWLTFFCGFGLGTMLTPVFYLMFKDMTLAIAATAIVHFLNNVFKFLLMKRSVNWQVAIPFGAAAIPAAFLGAFLATKIDNQIIYEYVLIGRQMEIDLLNFVFGLILVVFALIELIPSWSVVFSKKSLALGGLISGFFGGLSGHQGALRTAFLIKYNLKKEVFIATGIVVALVIDVVRTSVYAISFDYAALGESWVLIVMSLIAALVGAITGKLFLKKIKLDLLNIIVAIAMLVFGVTLAGGILN